MPYSAKSIRKYVGKTYRKARSVAKKRYIKKGNLNSKQLVKDVMYLKSVLNPEKKRWVQQYNTNLALGQVNANTAGYFVYDVSPYPAQGTGYNQVSGSSLKLHSSMFSFMLQQQANTANKITVHAYIYQVKGNGYPSVATFVTDNWIPNTFITGASVIDYNSDRDVDHFNNSKLIRYWRMTVPNDQVTQTTCKQFKIGLKYNKGQGHHIRYENNATTSTPTQGQLIMVLFADNGNCGALSTLGGGVPILTASTGLTVNYQFTHYFYDN